MNGPNYPIGTFDRRITIVIGTTETVDAIGEVISSIDVTKDVMARVQWMHRDERQIEDKQTDEQIKKVIIRWLPNINTKMKIILDSETYDIIRITEEGRNRWLSIDIKRYE